MTKHDDVDDRPEPKTWAELGDMIDRGERGRVVSEEVFWRRWFDFVEDWPVELLEGLGCKDRVDELRKRFEGH